MRTALAVGALSVALLGFALADSVASSTQPLVQQAPKLIGGEAESGEGRLGQSAALSADGNTALVGAPNDEGKRGAVWVFTREGSTWTEQAKLTGGEEESGEGRFGHSVALSADGDTVLVGAMRNDGGLGTVWVFTREGSTWTEQAKLTGGEEESGNGWFGAGVALSADGDTALVGAPVDHANIGAVWVFTREGSTWTQQGKKLAAGEEASEGGWFGAAVALSEEGSTAVIGSPSHSAKQGAAWVFTREGSTWTEQANLTGGEEEGGAGHFGDSVALSASGATALIGARDDTAKQGAAWVFTRAGSTWTEQGKKLTGGTEDGEEEFGDSVALSADGEKALIGGRRASGELGAAWVFKPEGSTWTQQGTELTGGEEWGRGGFGSSVALSGDGETALIGGEEDRRKIGAAWVFATPPPEPQPTGTQTAGNQTPPSGSGGSSSTTSTSAKQGVAAFKEARARVSLLSATVTVKRNGRALVKLKCLSTVTCHGTLKLTSRVGRKKRSRTIDVGGAAFVLAPGRTSTVMLPLNSGGRSRLHAAHGRLGARLTIAVLAPGSRTQTYAVRLVLVMTRSG